MSGLRDHRVSSIGFTLLGSRRWMGMDIGNYLELALTTVIPKWDKTGTIEADDSSVERIWVEVVIADEIGNSSASPWSEEKSTAFPHAAPTLTKFPDEPEPEKILDS